MRPAKQEIQMVGACVMFQHSCGKLHVGDTIDVDARTWPGINQHGGAGRIMRKNDDGTFAVKYLVAGNREKSVKRCYIHKQDILASGTLHDQNKRTRRSRQFLSHEQAHESSSPGKISQKEAVKEQIRQPGRQNSNSAAPEIEVCSDPDSMQQQQEIRTVQPPSPSPDTKNNPSSSRIQEETTQVLDHRGVGVVLLSTGLSSDQSQKLEALAKQFGWRVSHVADNFDPAVSHVITKATPTNESKRAKHRTIKFMHAVLAGR